MKIHERDDHIHEAMRILSGLQSLLCETGEQITIEADGLYVLLGCALSKLKATQT